MFRRRRTQFIDGVPADAGIAMLAVVGYGMVIMLIGGLISGYALNSIKSARRAQDFDGAVAAAQAGVDTVIATLRANPSSAATLPASDWTAVPGSKDPQGDDCAMTNPAGNAAVPVNCPQFKYSTVYDAGTKDITVYAAGKVRNNSVRAVKVTVHQADYTDYLYYSEVEAADPADSIAYPGLLFPNGGPAACGKRAWPATDARPASVNGVTCQVPPWRADGSNGDSTQGSTVHSNDMFTTQGSPEFDSKVTSQYDKCAPGAATPAPCSTSLTTATPTFDQGDPTYAGGLDTAPTTLRSTANCIYTGPTRIKFVGNQMLVWSPQTQAADNPGQNCGGGPQSLIDTVTSALNSVGGLLGIVGGLTGVSLDNLTKVVNGIVPNPTPVPIPAGIYVRNNDGTPARPGAPNPPAVGNNLYCLLGTALGMYGTLDADVTGLVTNPLSTLSDPNRSCSAGHLYVDGAFDGHSTIGTDGNITITSDLRYANASGSTFEHNGSTLGLVSTNGSVEVWSPLQCTLALATCLSLNPNNITPLKALGEDIHIEAAIMAMNGHFGVSLPLLQPAAFIDLLNHLASATIPTPKIDLYGSVAMKYRGVIGADLINLNVGVNKNANLFASLAVGPGAADLDTNINHINVADVHINLGYFANYQYDPHLRTSPPLNMPTPLTSTWVQNTFAEIPVANLPFSTT
jgi:hypothetical protein